MFKKTILAAAALASVMTLAATSAKADTSISLGFGFGGFNSGYGYPDYGYPDYGYPDSYYPRRHGGVYWDDARPRISYRISCGTGRNIVRNAGFHNITAYDCSAPTYGYKAWRDGDLFKVVVNYRGNIVSVRPIW